MERIPALSGAADGPYERLLYRLVVDDALIPIGIGDVLSVGQFPGESAVTIVARDHAATWERLPGLLKNARGTGVRVVVVGGPAALAGRLRAAIPRFTGAGIQAWHVAEDGVLTRVAGGASGLGRALAQPERPGPLDWERFWETATSRERERSSSLTGFQQGMARRAAPATPILLGIVGVMYLVELWTGAMDFPPAMYRLGVLDGPVVRSGEVWRLVSHIFLHGSLVHLGFNSLVLWSLGRGLERILGTWRFLLLFTLAGIGGGLLSVMALNGRSVGASGALWGLLAAQGLLAWRTRGVFPDALQARLRQGAVQNLVLNVMVSFQPGVDWAAHLGGGLVGAALVLSGALTVGLPRWAEHEGAEDRVPGLVRLGGAFSAVTLAAGLLAAVGFGRVWALGDPGATDRVAVSDGFTADIPTSLGPPPADLTIDPTGERVFGDIQHDPALVSVAIQVFPEVQTSDALSEARPDFERALSNAGDGWSVDKAPVWRDVGGDSLLVTRLVNDGSLPLQRAAMLRPEGLCRVDVVAWPEAGAGWQDLAATIATSCRR